MLYPSSPPHCCAIPRPTEPERNHALPRIAATIRCSTALSHCIAGQRYASAVPNEGLPWRCCAEPSQYSAIRYRAELCRRNSRLLFTAAVHNRAEPNPAAATRCASQPNLCGSSVRYARAVLDTTLPKHNFAQLGGASASLYSTKPIQCYTSTCRSKAIPSPRQAGVCTAAAERHSAKLHRGIGRLSHYRTELCFSPPMLRYVLIRQCCTERRFAGAQHHSALPHHAHASRNSAWHR